MIIVRNNEAQLSRLLDSLRNILDSANLEKVLLNSNMTEHDFSVLKAEVDSEDGIESDDVYEFINDYSECREDILHHVIGQMGDEAIGKIKRYMDEYNGEYKLVRVYRFNELDSKAQKFAVDQHIARLEVEDIEEYYDRDPHLIHDEFLNDDNIRFMKSGVMVVDDE